MNECTDAAILSSVFLVGADVRAAQIKRCCNRVLAVRAPLQAYVPFGSSRVICLAVVGPDSHDPSRHFQSTLAWLRVRVALHKLRGTKSARK